jgi:predicted acyl esterase
MKQSSVLFFLCCAFAFSCQSQKNLGSGGYVEQNYFKIDTTIAMRDGIKLYTVIYYDAADSL